MQAHPWPRPRKWQLTRPLVFLLVAVFTDDNCLGIFNATFIIFIRHRTAENNQRHMSQGFKNILFGDNMHYVDLCIGVFGKSGTTKIWGGAFAPPAPPLATLRHCATAVTNASKRLHVFDLPYRRLNIVMCALYVLN